MLSSFASVHDLNCKATLMLSAVAPSLDGEIIGASAMNGKMIQIKEGVWIHFEAGDGPCCPDDAGAVRK
jgi:hypothetical protein